MTISPRAVGLATLAVGLAGLQLPASASAVAAATTAPSAATAERVAPPQDKADLDVLYVGAHPDDEAFRLSTFGQWRERYGARTGVVTITRGEGGGNAVGPEEGPALGLIREREERSAVGMLGVHHVFNLDKVDFYYSVSAPLHQKAWGQRDTLRRLVRIIRETRPEIVITMNPAPSPGNHGGHQDAGLLATQAYYAAGNPSRFPGQLRSQGLEPFAPAKLFTNQALGTVGATGPNCPTAFTPQRPTEDVYGVWEGRRAASGATWAQLERDAQRRYASQGWAVFPDVPPDPQNLGCDFFTQVDARVPFTRGHLTADAAWAATSRGPWR
jgi:LmbE family N-acetylglucosaminyl deacetylase